MRGQGSVWPAVTQSRLFWGGMITVIVIHMVNGTRAWIPAFFLQIPLKFDFTPLAKLFENVGKVNTGWSLFTPVFYPSLIAFAFFLTTEVSLSLGLSTLFWTILGTFFVANGMVVQGGWAEGNMQNLLMFGSYVGVAVIVLYVGRRHYWDVTKAAVGFSRSVETPGYSVWAARLLALCVGVGVWLLTTAGLDWVLALIFIGLCLLIMSVVARANAETGAIFLQAGWLPMAIIGGLLGMEQVGPTAYIIMAIASVTLVCDPREAVMPYLVNAMEISDRAGGVAPRKISPVLAVMVGLGLVAALTATLWYQYRFGLSVNDGWARNNVSQMPLDKLTSHVSALSATDSLQQSLQIHGLQRIWSAAPTGETLGWIGLGVGLVLVTAAARLRLSWWPLHPVIFLFWGTYPASVFAYSFLLGWLIKTAVVKLMGAKGYHQIKPLMVGIISGELLAILLGLLIGGCYYAAKGLLPIRYAIFPS